MSAAANVMKTCNESMEKALTHLKNEFKTVRTGRASPALVEHVTVDYYGSKTAIKNMATITVQDASTLIIKPFDMSAIKAITKGIQEANIGLNPVDDGKIVRISLPPMTEETRKKIAAKLKEYAEHAKHTVRNARQEANKAADAAGKDKNSGLSEDNLHDLKDDIQKATNAYNKKIDDATAEKTKEVMSI